MDGWTDQQLTIMGWSVAYLRGEIAAGRLRAIEQGSGFFVTTENWQAWVATYNPARNKSGPSGPGARQAATVANDAWTEWSGLVEQLVSNGTPRHIAIQGIDALHPGLRQAAVESFNQQQRRREQAETERIRSERDRRRFAHMA